jgi:hypothetical protein
MIGLLISLSVTALVVAFMVWSSLNDVEQKAAAMEVEISRMREASEPSNVKSAGFAKYGTGPDEDFGIATKGTKFVFRPYYVNKEGVVSSSIDMES